MRPIKRLISVEEAMSLALGHTKPVESSEVIELREAVGRVAAEDVISRLSVPPFTRGAMDGYAVRARDTFGATKMEPITLTKIETIYAGIVPKKTISRGTCSEIATGAMLPRGADAVVMVENTESTGTDIHISESVHPGQNVSKKGEDIRPKARIVSTDEVLNPAKVGALAAVGIDRVRVWSKPLVAIVPTGNEIAEVGERLKPGQVYNINGHTLSSVVEANGGRIRQLKITEDSVPALERVVRANRDCDMIVFSGGSSVGERDVMIDVLERSGRVIFHGIAMKPGKPTLFGMIGRQLVWGMPGYPTACLSNAYVVLAPIMRKMAHLPKQEPPFVEARMAKRIASTTGRTQFLSVRLENGLAHSVFKESGAITSMAHADGYIIIPADVDLVEKGEKVRVHLL